MSRVRWGAAAVTNAAANTVVSGKHATRPMLPTIVRTTSSATISEVTTSDVLRPGEVEEQQQRKCRPCVCQHQRVHRRRDVVPTDSHASAVHGTEALGGLGEMDLPDGGGPGDGLVVEHTE